MNEYKDIWNFKVLDEIRNGNTVYLLDKTKAGTHNAVVVANDMRIKELIKIIDDPNKDNRYEFFKLERFEENEKGTEE